MQRYAFFTRLRPECRDQYAEVHQNVWPELLSRYRQIGIRNFSCFLLADMLFLYLESDDYEAVEAALMNDPVDLEWQKLVGPMQDPSGFQKLAEIFHMD